MSMTLVSSLGNHNDFVSESNRLLNLYSDAVKQLRVPLADKEFYETCFISPVREQLVLSTSAQLHNNNNKHEQEEEKMEKPKEFLIALRTLCKYLETHRITTLNVLQLCQHRDEIVTELLQYCEHYENNNNNNNNSNSNNGVESQISDDEIITLFLEKLKEHHLVTLVLVEAIFNWREQLTRPFSFNVSGANYIYRILEDCAMMDSSKLGVAVQLQLREYPLGSNNSYTHKRSGRSRKKVRHSSANSRTHSSSSNKTTNTTNTNTNNNNNNNNNNNVRNRYNTSLTSMPLMQGNPSLCRRTSATLALKKKHKLKQGGGQGGGGGRRLHREEEKSKIQQNKDRLLWGEAVIKGEHALQQQLLSELIDMAEEGYFVTFLAMPDILQDSDKGLPLAEDCTEVWRKRLLIPKDEHLIGLVGSQQRSTNTHSSTNNNNNNNKTESKINENGNTNGTGIVFSEKRPSAVYSSLSVISSSTESSSLLSSSSSSSSRLSSLSSSFVQLSTSSSTPLSPESSPEK